MNDSNWITYDKDGYYMYDGELQFQNNSFLKQSSIEITEEIAIILVGRKLEMNEKVQVIGDKTISNKDDMIQCLRKYFTNDQLKLIPYHANGFFLDSIKIDKKGIFTLYYYAANKCISLQIRRGDLLYLKDDLLNSIVEYITVQMCIGGGLNG